jgi:hypothetical protein
MREVVFHFEADTPSSSATRSRPARSVFYHFFKVTDAPDEGPSVERMALLRAPANPDDADAEETVQGTLTLTVEDFLRSKLYNQMDSLLLLPSEFKFYDAEAEGVDMLPAALPAALPALVEASAVEASAVEASAVEASAVEASAVETPEAPSPAAAPEAAAAQEEVAAPTKPAETEQQQVSACVRQRES